MRTKDTKNIIIAISER